MLRFFVRSYRQMEHQRLQHGRDTQGVGGHFGAGHTWTQGTDPRRGRHVRHERLHAAARLPDHAESSVDDFRTHRRKFICCFFTIGKTFKRSFFVFFLFAQTSIPYKTYAIHIINESWVFETVFNLFKPFLGKRVNEMVSTTEYFVFSCSPRRRCTRAAGDRLCVCAMFSIRRENRSLNHFVPQWNTLRFSRGERNDVKKYSSTNITLYFIRIFVNYSPCQP